MISSLKNNTWARNENPLQLRRKINLEAPCSIPHHASPEGMGCFSGRNYAHLLRYSLQSSSKYCANRVAEVCQGNCVSAQMHQPPCCRPPSSGSNHFHYDFCMCYWWSLQRRKVDSAKTKFWLTFSQLPTVNSRVFQSNFMLQSLLFFHLLLLY